MATVQAQFLVPGDTVSLFGAAREVQANKPGPFLAVLSLSGGDRVTVSRFEQIPVLHTLDGRVQDGVRVDGVES